MARKLLHSFYLDPDLTQSLKAASDGEYMPQGQIVRHAIRTWLEVRRYLAKEAKGKGGKRKR